MGARVSKRLKAFLAPFAVLAGCVLVTAIFIAIEKCVEHFFGVGAVFISIPIVFCALIGTLNAIRVS